MTETEKLKESRDRQYFTERLTEIFNRIDELHVKADAQEVLIKRSQWLERAALATWVITLFLASNAVQDLTWTLWVLIILRNIVFVQSTLMSTVNELKGMYKTLEILGIFPKDESKGKRKKMKSYKRSLIAERWARVKSKLRKEAYA